METREWGRIVPEMESIGNDATFKTAGECS